MKKILVVFAIFILPLYALCQSPAGFVVEYCANLECEDGECGTDLTIDFEGAEFIKVHLKNLDLSEGERLEFFSGDNSSQYFSFNGPYSGSLYLPSLSGESCYLKLVGKNAKLTVDKIGIGLANLQNRVERICGNDDRLDPACYDNSYRNAGDKIGRIMFEINGLLYYCSGFLVSEDGIFITNQHCIQNSEAAESAEVWWRYENFACGGNSTSYESVSSSAELLASDAGLDISILKFKYDNPASRYGYLELDDRKLEKGEIIWIPQHPLGGPKKFAVHSDSDGGATVIEVGLKGVRINQAIGYNLDVEAGSSGSPVLDQNNNVVAMHTFTAENEGCKVPDLNKGLKMQYLFPVIFPYTVSCNGTPPTITKIKYNAKNRKFKVEGVGFDEDSKILVNGIAQDTHYKKDGLLVCAMFERIFRQETVTIEVFNPKSGCRSEKKYFTRS